MRKKRLILHGENNESLSGTDVASVVAASNEQPFVLVVVVVAVVGRCLTPRVDDGAVTANAHVNVA